MRAIAFFLLSLGCSGEETGGVPAGDECVDHADCADDVFCNGEEVCHWGYCYGGSITCDDGVPETMDRCSEDAGACSHEPFSDGGP